MTARSRIFVGLDLGTSSLKGVGVDEDGCQEAMAEATYPTSRPGPGWAEQSPNDWLDALRSVVGSLTSQAPALRWEGIGLSGMIPTLVTAGRDGHATGPAITWEDARAEGEGTRLREEIGPDRLYAITGQWVDGRYLLPMFGWLAAHDPDRTKRTASLFSAKDYLYEWLTGERCTDPSTATGFGCFDLELGAWSEEILAAAKNVFPCSLEPVAIPEIRPSSSASPLRGGILKALGLPTGLPIFLGGADSVLACLALGVTEPGLVAYIAGTSTVILGASDRPLRDHSHRYLITPLAEPGLWGLEMDLLSTGSAMAWLADLFGLKEAAGAQVLSLAQRSEAGARGLAFLPYLGVGEQGALWDPTLRGALVGITLSHNRSDLARALIEGILVESRRCTNVLTEAGMPRGEIRVAGHPARSSWFRSQLADATGRPVKAAGKGERLASAWGAALLAARALDGRYAGSTLSLSAASAPTLASQAPWEALAARQDQLRLALGPNGRRERDRSRRVPPGPAGPVR